MQYDDCFNMSIDYILCGVCYDCFASVIGMADMEMSRSGSSFCDEYYLLK
jgi:hypothetical protein